MPKVVFFNSIFDEIEELSYARIYQNIFDQYIAEFVSYELQERQIEENFSNKTAILDPQDEIQRKKDLDATFTMKKSRQKNMQKNI